MILKKYEYIIGKIIIGVSLIISAKIIALGLAQAGHNLGANLILK